MLVEKSSHIEMLVIFMKEQTTRPTDRKSSRAQREHLSKPGTITMLICDLPVLHNCGILSAIRF
jgi:hypothetical protein